MKEYRCVSCDEVFEITREPDYCPYCGNPKNEQFGMKVAQTNPNITGFLPQ